mmetsp:Transcript_18566/g.47572  ORF Transcript_18566/g.47572 Transcript_18566/m.47572 type:complete len:226 (-) Transcript_18566:148-825(-)
MLKAQPTGRGSARLPRSAEEALCLSVLRPLALGRVHGQHLGLALGLDVHLLLDPSQPLLNKAEITVQSLLQLKYGTFQVIQFLLSGLHESGDLPTAASRRARHRGARSAACASLGLLSGHILHQLQHLLADLFHLGHALPEPLGLTVKILLDDVHLPLLVTEAISYQHGKLKQGLSLGFTTEPLARFQEVRHIDLLRLFVEADSKNLLELLSGLDPDSIFHQLHG